MKHCVYVVLNYLQEIEGGAHAALTGLREAKKGLGRRPRQTPLPAPPGTALGVLFHILIIPCFCSTVYQN